MTRRKLLPYLALFWAVDALVALLAAWAMVGLNQFYNARACNAPTEVSKSCIATANLEIAKLDKRSSGQYGEGRQYGVTVSYNGKLTTMWFEEPFSDLRVGDQMVVKAWNGCIISATNSKGVEQKEFEWDAGFLRGLTIFWFVLGAFVLAATIACWRYRQAMLAATVANGVLAAVSLFEALVWSSPA